GRPRSSANLLFTPSFTAATPVRIRLGTPAFQRMRSRTRARYPGEALAREVSAGRRLDRSSRLSRTVQAPRSDSRVDSCDASSRYAGAGAGGPASSAATERVTARRPEPAGA